MFGSNYFGQPYFGQGYAGPTGVPVVQLDGIIDGEADAQAALLRLALMQVMVDGEGVADSDLTRVDGSPATGRLQRFRLGGRITLEEQ